MKEFLKSKRFWKTPLFGRPIPTPSGHGIGYKEDADEAIGKRLNLATSMNDKSKIVITLKLRERK